MIQRFIGTFIANAIAFLLAAYFVTNFVITFEPLSFTLLVALFTAIQLFLRPIIKFVLSPLIILTLGLFNLVITGAFLYIIDIYSQNISISGTAPLVYGTLIITITNILLQTRKKETKPF